MAVLIGTADELAENVIRYELIVEAAGNAGSSRLVARMASHRSWICAFDDQGAHLGPSKFVGYADLSVEEYLASADRKDIDGRDTEPVIKRLVEPLRSTDGLFMLADEKLRNLFTPSRKRPNKLYRIAIVKGYAPGSGLTPAGVIAAEESFRREVRRLRRETKSPESSPPAGNASPRHIPIVTTRIERDPHVAAYVLDRSGGICEGCRRPAPFKRRSDHSDYLEVHHKMPLAEGGPDTVENAVAICPNCHRNEHYGSARWPCTA